MKTVNFGCQVLFAIVWHQFSLAPKKCKIFYTNFAAYPHFKSSTILSMNPLLSYICIVHNTLNTFYLRLYGIRHMVKDHSDSGRGNRCCHMGYSFRLTATVLLYAPSHRQDSTYHSLCYTSCGALAGTRNSSMGPPHEGSIRQPVAPWANAFTMELHLAPQKEDDQMHC